MKERIVSVSLALMLVFTTITPIAFAEEGENEGIVPVSDIVLNSTSETVYVGKSKTLGVSVLPENATSKEVVFESSNSDIAKVSSSGVVTGVKVGSTTVSVITTDGSNITKTCNITVKKYVSSIKLNVTKITGNIGLKKQLSAKVGPADASSKKVKYSSSNKYVATISSTGIVKLVGPGKSTISVKATDGSGKVVKCYVIAKAKKPGWLTVGSRKYYINKKLQVVKGIKSIGGIRYYFSKTTGVLQKKKMGLCENWRKKIQIVF